MNNANGTKGYLLNINNKTVFRVYYYPHGKAAYYVDYEIRHDDPQMVIADDSVKLLIADTKNGKGFLDYTKESEVPVKKPTLPSFAQIYIRNKVLSHIGKQKGNG
jgi:hypothetical protein